MNDYEGRGHIVAGLIALFCDGVFVGLVVAQVLR